MKISDNAKYNAKYNAANHKREPVAALRPLCRKIAAEGTILLKNENNTLPFNSGETISVFGRTAVDYLPCGTGSGGAVHPPYASDIQTALRRRHNIKLYKPLADTYKRWLRRNPFDRGHGWATEPWCQEEYVPGEALVADAAAGSDKALVILGRLAGEDKDNSAAEGSYFLTSKERELLSLVTRYFDKVAVVLNTGNIIDMKWVEEYGVEAVLYIWQGGQEGGGAAADVLCGTVSPSGRLPDTIAYNIEDYPSHADFGGRDLNLYTEDIYVGYRYFETFAKDKVMYPFGFGLSYTSFDVKYTDAHASNGKIFVTASVSNTGSRSGRHVIQLYYEAPQGALGKPLRQLAAYAKTKTLAPGKSDRIKLSFPIKSMASYDDSGAAGFKSCFVLEEGDYVICLGDNVRDAAPVYTYTQRRTVATVRCTEALSPCREFYRIKPVKSGKDYIISHERVPVRTYDIAKRIEASRPVSAPYTGDMGIRLIDAALGKSTLDDFIAQISDEGLASLVRGEGMGSKKTDVWSTAVIGGITPELSQLGIPVSANSDGPSGIRSDAGEPMTLLPGGAIFASSFDDALTEKIFAYEGVELVCHHLDALLGPGMNLHRHPCNGRNFEYFSEDPLLTGKIAAAETRGLAAAGGSATLKHFIANSQEHRRSDCDSVMSERAARELYLRGFEIAVKEGGAKSIMTSYNLVNGIHSASNYDLNTTILRGEWGFDGFVMTDWGAKMNFDGCPGKNDAISLMVRAQNDVYMVVGDASVKSDDIMSALESGIITRGELARSAANILRFIMNTPTFHRYIAGPAST